MNHCHRKKIPQLNILQRKIPTDEEITVEDTTDEDNIEEENTEDDSMEEEQQYLSTLSSPSFTNLQVCSCIDHV